jgi:uncharacterized membrane protein
MNPTSGVLAEAWALYKAHWRHLVPIALVVYLAVSVLSTLFAVTLGWIGLILALIVSLTGVFLVQGALTHAVEDVRDGRADLSLGETLDAVKPKVGAIALASIVAGLGIGLGLILLIIPGLILLTLWILIVPVIVLEDVPWIQAFGRSGELVKGYGFQVFGILILTLLLRIVFNAVLGVLTAFFPETLQTFVVEVIGGSLTAPFVAATWTLLYFRLREAQRYEPGPPQT